MGLQQCCQLVWLQSLPWPLVIPYTSGLLHECTAFYPQAQSQSLSNRCASRSWAFHHIGAQCSAFGARLMYTGPWPDCGLIHGCVDLNMATSGPLKELRHWHSMKFDACRSLLCMLMQRLHVVCGGLVILEPFDLAKIWTSVLHAHSIHQGIICTRCMGQKPSMNKGHRGCCCSRTSRAGVKHQAGQYRGHTSPQLSPLALLSCSVPRRARDSPLARRRAVSYCGSFSRPT